MPKKITFILLSAVLLLTIGFFQFRSETNAVAHASNVKSAAFKVVSNLVVKEGDSKVVSEFAYLVNEEEVIDFLENETKKKEEEEKQKLLEEETKIMEEASEKARELEKQLKQEQEAEDIRIAAEKEKAEALAKAEALVKQKEKEKAEAKAREEAEAKERAKEVAEAKKKAQALVDAKKNKTQSVTTQQTTSSEKANTDIETPKSTGEWKTFKATAYTPYCAGCSGVTKTGFDLRKSIYKDGKRVIAVDPSVIPLHSTVEIKLSNGTTYYATAQDIGGAIKGNIIDVAHETTNQALSFGRQTIQVRIVK